MQQNDNSSKDNQSTHSKDKPIRLLAEKVSADEVIKRVGILVAGKQHGVDEKLNTLIVYLAYHDSDDKRLQAEAMKCKEEIIALAETFLADLEERA